MLEDATIAKIHSTVRWGKSEAELDAVVQEVGLDLPTALALADPKNGNRALHIAAQNGHLGLVVFMLANTADVNAQNAKGQTALHMSVEYDFYFQSDVLLRAGADPKITNAGGHEAIAGMDGGKTGDNAWDTPLKILEGAGNDPQQLEVAFVALEKADLTKIDKADLVQTGMKKKKTCTGNWDSARFMALVTKA